MKSFAYKNPGRFVVVECGGTAASSGLKLGKSTQSEVILVIIDCVVTLYHGNMMT